tara:strand:- start:5291 stop:5926 length:636 start_codon:yes stop_codon:yes gene_type:complete
VHKLSIRGSTFASHGEAVEVVIVNAAKVSRAYFVNAFDDSKTVAPTCWSVDTQRPDAGVPETQRQATRCLDCKQNIRGSAGRGRACRFQQKLAVAFVDDLEKIYQLQLPATSIFGKTVGGHMPLQEYVRHLSKHNTASVSIVTNIYFDSSSVVPKLFFKPVCGLNKEQLETVSGMIDHPDTHEAITSVVQQSATSSPFDSVEGYVYKPNHS